MATQDPVLPGNAAVPVLLDFLSSVPYQLTAALVRLGPYISALRQLAEVTSWSTSWYDSWLAIAAWWALCLLLELTVQYLLPATFLFVYLVSKWTTPRRTSGSPPITEQNLQATITDLVVLQSLLPSIPFEFNEGSLSVLVRVCAILYIPYLVITHCISLRVLFGIAGTILLSWRAPWTQALRTTLWKSAWFRWGVYRAWSRLSGRPLPVPTVSTRDLTIEHERNSARFLFMIYENQRWWMGLDWTAALLPSERPSWCSASLQPVPPPSAMTLPGDSVVYVGDGKGGREKRTAKWAWEEAEWRVCVRREGSAVVRVEKPLPTPKGEGPGESQLAKVDGKMRESQNAGGSGEDAQEDDGQDNTDEDPETDPDGWVYGDNKWENRSAKGGIGKYTRYRRWTRVAVVNETVEVVGAGDVGIEQQTRQNSTSHSRESSVDNDRGSPLRQRLKNALNRQSISPSSSS
ncbi:Peroxin/Dysferlin domain-containing protein [Armillaria borealis]|uniref:Peroxin/Dysferlin domain-containing protein n=1 Tax=Armillaria borealis TaxID=47425 RepID=A0AA39N2N0_9AGAR|nr:Peroxin/Dysferlin domain-containing protein [Armillaria borealis]